MESRGKRRHNEQRDLAYLVAFAVNDPKQLDKVLPKQGPKRGAQDALDGPHRPDWLPPPPGGQEPPTGADRAPGGDVVRADFQTGDWWAS
jgi:hypothetical protein